MAVGSEPQVAIQVHVDQGVSPADRHLYDLLLGKTAVGAGASVAWARGGRCRRSLRSRRSSPKARTTTAGRAPVGRPVVLGWWGTATSTIRSPCSRALTRSSVLISAPSA